MDISPSPFGGSKNAEYQRSAELFIEICKTQKAYFAISFLSDSGYNNSDLREIQKRVHVIQFNRGTN